MTVDISNICNAKCKWCSTGIKNRSCVTKEKFMDTAQFSKVLKYCLENEIIDENADIELYSWGEPFLNPHLKEIIDVIIENNFSYNLSTNGSKKVILNKEQIEKITFLMFSLSGFSQKTYGKIHGLSLEQILSNIREMVKPFQEFSMCDKVEINFHVYQFNLGELHTCKAFCEELGIRFVPRYAYLADWELFQAYLNGTMERKILLDVSKELFFHYYETIKEEQPLDYICPQNERLFIDSEGFVLPCAFSIEDRIGSIFDMNLKEICYKKETYYKCKECLKSGQAYIAQQYTQFLSEYENADLKDIEQYGEKLKSSLYYARNNESFNEENKLYAESVIRKNGHFLLNFELCKLGEGVISALRFDPCEYPCSIKNLEVFADGKLCNHVPYNASKQENNTIVFETSDPVISLQPEDFTNIKNITVYGYIF